MAEFKSTISSQNFDKALQGGLDYAADKSGIWEALENAGGLTDTEKAFMLTLFKNAAYTADVSATITKLEALWSGSEEPDEPIEPDDPDIPVVNTYTVTNTLTNVTNSNTAASVTEGASYTATLTADEGYNIDSVTVTVGGVDVTASVYANGVVSISNVSGNIVITATAAEIPAEDDENNGWVNGEAYTIEWKEGYTLNTSTGAEEAKEGGYYVSDYLPCRGANRFVGANLRSNYKFWFYDENKNFLGMSDTSMVADANMGGVRRGAYFVRTEATKTTGTVTPYQDELLTETTVYEAGKYYRLKWNAGWNINSSTGVAVEKEGCNATDFALCYGATTLYNGTTERHFYYFYDADKAFIKSETIGNSPKSITVPDGATYFRAVYDGVYIEPWVKLS